ncbi:MAG: LacI family DNA-binding transcriptional regulator [Inhella sp.]
MRKNSRSAAGSGKVTLGMVAEACGVSPSTVSRILNGTAIVSEEKRAAVDRAIAELGFVPNPIARGLAGGRTMSVGVITQVIDSPFYGVALRGIEEELDPLGYSPLFVSGHWNAEHEKRCFETLMARRVDGLIILTGRLSNATLKAIAKQIPTVITGRELKAPNLFSLDFDNYQGARLATEHLLERGHRDIAHIAGDPLHPDAIERLRGYRDALEVAGVPFRESLVLPGMYFEESGREMVERLLASGQRFTAIFAANDQMAFGAAVALHARGLRVPDDVSLVGFDDLAPAAHVVPPLTTVHQAGRELGRAAARALLALLNGTEPKEVLPAPQLIVRASTRAPVPATVKARRSAKA